MKIVFLFLANRSRSDSGGSQGRDAVWEVEQTDSRSVRGVREVEILDEGVEERGVSSVRGAFVSTGRLDGRAMFVGGRVDGRVR